MKLYKIYTTDRKNPIVTIDYDRAMDIMQTANDIGKLVNMTEQDMIIVNTETGAII